ncbi:MAG: iron-containing redox enzyme family protein [Vicinamibacterales bacterium]|jgi:hypothetical protein
MNGRAPDNPPDVAAATLACLRTSIDALLVEIKAMDEWRQLTEPSADPQRVRAILREVYREVALYQPDVIEATIAVIGQFPRSLAAKQVRTMLIHQSEEWDHGEMAARDFVAMGGDEREVRGQLMTHTAFATAAFWRMLAHKRLPFAYLGALYLFEGLTPIVTGLLKGSLSSQGYTPDGMEYVEFHATEDIKHAKVVDHLILQTVRQYPHCADEIIFGFKAFRHVYPLPGWKDAVKRAGESR